MSPKLHSIWEYRFVEPSWIGPESGLPWERIDDGRRDGIAQWLELRLKTHEACLNGEMPPENQRAIHDGAPCRCAEIRDELLGKIRTDTRTMLVKVCIQVFP